MFVGNNVIDISQFGKHNCVCPVCYQYLNFESHNDGDLDLQYWIATCKCKDRMYRIDVESVRCSILEI